MLVTCLELAGLGVAMVGALAMVRGQAWIDRQARVAMLELLRAHYRERLGAVEAELGRLGRRGGSPSPSPGPRVAGAPLGRP